MFQFMCNECFYLHCILYVQFLGIAVRLVGGSSFNQGRVEVNYNGEWGTVCYYGWTYSNTYVMCRQLGLGTYGYYYYFGRESGPAWLENVKCAGDESTIASCGHPGVNITRSCTYYAHVVGIVCYGNQGTANFVNYT